MVTDRAANITALEAIIEAQNREIERLRAVLRKIDVGEGWAAQLARAALKS